MERRLFLPPQSSKLSAIKLSRLTAQTIPTAVGTDIVYDAPIASFVDTNVYSYNAATGLITFLKTGWYTCTHVCNWVANAVGNRTQALIITDGVLYTVRDSILATNPDITLNRIFEGTIRIINIGATLSFRVVQTSGGNLNVNGGVNNLTGSVVRLSDL